MTQHLHNSRVIIPTEGYAFSSDANAVLGTPSFSAASFSYNGQTLDMTNSLHY
jgi:uncharacterized protein (DUF2141 family)